VAPAAARENERLCLEGRLARFGLHSWSEDVANLWPEPWKGPNNAHMKDAVETYLNREVCRGNLPLPEAQREIATNWLDVYTSRALKVAE
jgi:hypothetical protein